MTTKAKWKNGVQVFYDSATFEEFPTGAVFSFKDDFIGAGGLATTPVAGSAENGYAWAKLDVSPAGAVVAGHVADGANGQFALGLDATDEAQDAVLYFGDQRGFNVKAGGVFETRASVAVLPGTGVALVFGLAGNHNLDKDTVAENAWFRLQAGASLLIETDDTTNDNDDQDTGIDIDAGDWHVYRIDFTDLTDVRFFVDGVNYSAGTTFDMSNLSDSEAIMQPYYSLDKASGTGLGTINIDYVTFWSKRTT